MIKKQTALALMLLISCSPSIIQALGSDSDTSKDEHSAPSPFSISGELDELMDHTAHPGTTIKTAAPVLKSMHNHTNTKPASPIQHEAPDHSYKQLASELTTKSLHDCCYASYAAAVWTAWFVKKGCIVAYNIGKYGHFNAPPTQPAKIKKDS